MSDLKIQFDWEDPCGAKGAELRATWARLTILAREVPITQVLDHRSRSVRNCIYGSLYPLAEWLATHWWFLFHEVESPNTGRQQTYLERHGLACAQEGFALPDLVLLPSGQEMVLRWNAAVFSDARVSFLQKGCLTVQTATARDELARFVSGVVARLEAEDVAGTLLQQEWAAIESLDPEERAFCETAARLGVDPFAMEEVDRARLVETHASLPRELADEFFASADFNGLAESTRILADALAQIRRLTVNLSPLAELRRHHPPVNRALEPWRQGYAFARDLRSQLGLDGGLFADVGGVARALGVGGDALERAILPAPKSCRLFDAVVGTNDQGNPGFVINKTGGASRKFAFCRSLFEYFNAPQPQGVALISAAHSDRQKANRAFAAEFLAPSEALRQRIQGGSMGEDQLEDLADEFGVSSQVIRHQIENHRLAMVISAS